MFKPFRPSAVLFCAAFLLFASSAFGKTLLLNSSFSLGDLGVNQATGISYDSTDDKLWLCDSGGADRIVEVPLAGGSIDVDYGLSFHAPEGITMNWSGNLALVDPIQDNIYTMLKSNGNLAGALPLNTTGVGGPAAFTVDTTDDTYWLADYANQRTFHIDTDGTILSSFSNGAYACEGIAYNSSNDKLFLACQSSRRIYEVNQSGGDGRAIDTTAFGCTSPVGVARNPSTGNLYVVDNNAGKIFEITDQGVYADSFDLNASNFRPTDVGYDSSTGTLYVSDNGSMDSVFEYQTDGTFLDSFSFGPAQTEGLAVIADGLLILDYAEVLVHKRNKDTGAYISAFEIANTGPVNVAGLTIDATCYWAADYNSQTVFRITQAGSVVGNFSTAGFGCLQPEGIYYDSAGGNLFIVDSNSDRLYEVNTSGTLQGSYDLSAHGINYPTGITMKNNEEDIYVVDIEDDRVYYLSLTEAAGVMPVPAEAEESDPDKGVLASGAFGNYREDFEGGTLYGYNTLGPGPVEVVDLDGNNVAEIIEGILAEGVQQPDGSVRMYTQIYLPTSATTLSFDYMMGEFDETNYFAVFFEGAEILMLDINDKTGYFQTVEVDISQFGGQTGELAFFLAGQSDDLNPDRIWLDNITVTGIPEPPAWMLFCVGSALLCATVRLRRRESRRDNEVKG
ncbi:MAG: hypothetical protein ABIH04_03910 [Planctomycetota bacterium]